MSTSSPADLAVAFRSLTRRLHQATTDEVTAADVGTATSSVQSAVATAAAVLGCAATTEAVAAAIESRHTRQWTDEDLAALQVSATEAARAIRSLENAAR